MSDESPQITSHLGAVDNKERVENASGRGRPKLHEVASQKRVEELASTPNRLGGIRKQEARSGIDHAIGSEIKSSTNTCKVG